jgi:hypothetical protein
MAQMKERNAASHADGDLGCANPVRAAAPRAIMNVLKMSSKTPYLLSPLFNISIVIKSLFAGKLLFW